MTSNLIAVLNNLVETSKDGERGFRKAAEEVRDAKLKGALLKWAEDCTRGGRELQDVVLQLGGKPENGGTMGGALQRGWMEVRAAVTEDTDFAILAECEKGEEIAGQHYRDALKQDLPADVREVIEQQFDGVMRNHAAIRDLQEQYAMRR